MPNTPLRNFYPVVVLLMLAACGGSSSSGQTYTIAGDISGLTSGDVVLANGTSTLTVTAGESSWQFPSAFAQGSLYLVAVQTQPAGEMCLVTGGASGKLTADVTGVTVACSEGLWTWEGGSSASSGGGVYGTQGTGSTSNLPGARESASSWTDSAGNLWLFGGYGYASSILGDLNDLWQYSPSTGEWTWISGTSALNATGVYGMQNAASPSNLPGARQQASAWIDSSGNLWLFGGYGYDSTHNADLNDLWQYSSTTGEWTWVSGSDVGNANGSYGAQGSPSTSNVPGAREGATSWIDSSGSLWLFGGYGHDSAGAVGNLNDLWRYNPNTGAWTWISGANTVNAAGAYGTAGVESGSNAPGGRQAASSWIDSSGNLWLFGGYGDDSAGNEGDLNDLWQYSPSTGEWTWISGADTVKA
ncbi:MAG: Kelch repeat-containing protein, partial [Solirubrobacteraceae bacterium]